MADSQVKPVRDDESEVDLGQGDVSEERKVHIKKEVIPPPDLKKPVRENSFVSDMLEGRKQEPTQWEKLSEKMLSEKYGRFPNL